GLLVSMPGSLQGEQRMGDTLRPGIGSRQAHAREKAVRTTKQPKGSARSCTKSGESVPYFTTSRMTVTLVSRGGMRSVGASKARSALSLGLLIGKSSKAVSKLETQMTSPSLAR